MHSQRLAVVSKIVMRSGARFFITNQYTVCRAALYADDCDVFHCSARALCVCVKKDASTYRVLEDLNSTNFLIGVLVDRTLNNTLKYMTKLAPRINWALLSSRITFRKHFGGSTKEWRDTEIARAAQYHTQAKEYLTTDEAAVRFDTDSQLVYSKTDLIMTNREIHESDSITQ